MSFFISQDGTALVNDPDLGVVSAPSVSEALVEIQRRKSFSLLRILPGGRDANRAYPDFSPRALSSVTSNEGEANGSGETNHGNFVRKFGGACV
jgi:hypothetical protein